MWGRKKPMDVAREFDAIFGEFGSKLDEEIGKEYQKSQEREFRERKKRIEREYPRYRD